MGKKIKWNGAALLAPAPCVMVSCGGMGDGESNIITIGWTGIVNTHPPMTYISVRPTRHSYGIIKETGEFAINLTPAALVRKADYCGVYTGKKVDKFKVCGFTKEKASELSCPIIAEAPLTLECRVKDVIPLGTHDMFLADIVAVDVDESLLDENGKLHLDRARMSAYMHGEYFALGEKLGKFGFSTDKPKKKAHPRHSNGKNSHQKPNNNVKSEEKGK